MEAFQLLLADNLYIILGLHLVGIVLGFGGAVITDVLFTKFLGNLKVSSGELRVLKTMSKIIWLGIFIIITSGILLFLSDTERYLNTPKFLAKMVVVCVIVLNGLVLNFVVTPKLKDINFGKIRTTKDKKTKTIRSLAFVTGSISGVSWWTAFIFGVINFSPAPLPILLLLYFSILASAIVCSLVLEVLVSSGRIKFPSI